MPAGTFAPAGIFFAHGVSRNGRPYTYARMTAAPERIAELEESLHCPLCGYDFRATTEPRCPECGYAFTWGELRDPARRMHPYAFEHHPERNVTSFVQTFFAGLRPKRFWRTLYPTQPSRPGRLVLYWLIVCAACVVPLVVQTARGWPVMESELRGMRNNASRHVAAAPNDYPDLQRYPTTQAYLDANWPMPTASTMLRTMARYDVTTRAMLFALGALIVWPWLTFVALMIFQFSMRRARIKPIHVLRAVLYTSDLALWVTAASLAAIGYQVLRFGWVGTGLWRGSPIDFTVLLILVVALVFYTWRLAAAYRHYLRFPHAASTALSVQVIVLLLLAVLALEWEVIRGY